MIQRHVPQRTRGLQYAPWVLCCGQILCHSSVVRSRSEYFLRYNWSSACHTLDACGIPILGARTLSWLLPLPDKIVLAESRIRLSAHASGLLYLMSKVVKEPNVS